MKLFALFVALGPLAGFAQQCHVIGTIDRITPSEIRVIASRGSFILSSNDRTETVKDKIYRGLNVLRAGDEISAECEAGSSGKLVAIKIWAKVVAFSATVKHITGDTVEVLTIANAEYPRHEHWTVRLHRDTAFGTRRSDIAEGQDIRVVGLDVGGGAVDAARITIYNTDLGVTK